MPKKTRRHGNVAVTMAHPVLAKMTIKNTVLEATVADMVARNPSRMDPMPDRRYRQSCNTHSAHDAKEATCEQSNSCRYG
mmetsp:Transcript_56964/g.151580  ORF Transcript_56964/g.151580 Transcript_56964/m.151580 type:complete len:80 (-) Transcript_56964:593-832(-)